MNHNFYMRYEPQFSHEYGLSRYSLGVTCWAPGGNTIINTWKKDQVTAPINSIFLLFDLWVNTQ